MPSPFQKYQSEQVQQIAPGFVEAYGRAGAAIGQGLAQTGQAVVQGYEEAKKKAEEDAVQKGALAPYLQRDKAKIEAGVKTGSLIKNPDGTVSINPENPNKDMLDTSAIDFYNKTGGDINKLSGVDLKQFVASFESKKKIEAQERESETSKVELDLKRAQTAKYNAEAAAATADVGSLNTIYNAAGFGNPAGGAAGSTIPTVPGSPVAPGAVARPSLAAYNGTGTSFSTSGTTALDTTFFESLARFDANKNRGVQPATTSAPAPAAEPFNLASAADRIGMTENDLVASAQGMGVTPEEYVKGYLGETSAPAAPAVSTALTAGTKPTTVSAGQPAQATTQTAAQPAAEPAVTPPADKVEIQPVRETAEVVQARINALGAERTRLIQKSQEEYAAKKIEVDAKKASIIVNKKTSQAANMLISYQESVLEEIKDRYKVEIDAVDSQIKAEQGKLDIAKTVAGSAAAVRAETAATEAAGRAVKKATREETEQQRADALAFPRIGPFVHLGSEIAAQGKEPSKYGIRPLTAQAQNEVNTLAEGWIKSSDFIIKMAETLEDRNLTGQDYTARMRIFTKDLENWATGELQQVFGVATFRRAIVSGGNFSDSDRLFVQRAITYINTLDPLDDKEVFEASTNALARFVDNMYRKSMSGYDMKFSTKGLLAQADRLEADGFPEEAAQQRELANTSQRFLDKFGIQEKGGRMTFDPDAVESARAVLWQTLDKGGQLKDADKEVKDGDVVFRLKDSAPKSK